MTHVLLLEDDATLRRELSLLLERHDLMVYACVTGGAAWEAFVQGTFDAVITDVRHPGIDGLELCRRIRAVSDTPVMLVTADSKRDAIQAGFAAGASDYVLKPFGAQDVLARLYYLLGLPFPYALRWDYDDGWLQVRFFSGFVQMNGSPVTLSDSALKTLELLLQVPRRVLPSVHTGKLRAGHVTARSVDADVEELRAALERAGNAPCRIETVNGGYQWVDESSES